MSFLVYPWSRQERRGEDQEEGREDTGLCEFCFCFISGVQGRRSTPLIFCIRRQDVRGEVRCGWKESEGDPFLQCTYSKRKDYKSTKGQALSLEEDRGRGGWRATEWSTGERE